jgi:hypothetical protein
LLLNAVRILAAPANPSADPFNIERRKSSNKPAATFTLLIVIPRKLPRDVFLLQK